MKLVAAGLGIAAVAGATAAVLVYSGVFNVAADEPHSAFVYEMLETVRDRSIAVRAKRIEVPPLDAPELIAKGAADYSDMCVDCHLAPGLEESELRQGLYPKPPKLTEHLNASPAKMFWVIKHGIKMSAMPAWGATHEDARIWSIVAFLRSSRTSRGISMRRWPTPTQTPTTITLTTPRRSRRPDSPAQITPRRQA